MTSIRSAGALLFAACLAGTLLSAPAHAAGETVNSWLTTTSAVGPITGLAGTCMDVTGANTADGAPLQLWSCHGGANQKWNLPT